MLDKDVDLPEPGHAGMDGCPPEGPIGAPEGGMDGVGRVAESHDGLRGKQEHYLVHDIVRELRKNVGADSRFNVWRERGGCGEVEVVGRDRVAEKNCKFVVLTRLSN